ncbi:hypothetical protein HAX54_024749, partial [Datura stramonium]|nr:hypothetical protein [Datura stramonium]
GGGVGGSTSRLPLCRRRGTVCRSMCGREVSGAAPVVPDPVSFHPLAYSTFEPSPAYA